MSLVYLWVSSYWRLAKPVIMSGLPYLMTVLPRKGLILVKMSGTAGKQKKKNIAFNDGS